MLAIALTQPDNFIYRAGPEWSSRLRRFRFDTAQICTQDSVKPAKCASQHLAPVTSVLYASLRFLPIMFWSLQALPSLGETHETAVRLISLSLVPP